MVDDRNKNMIKPLMIVISEQKFMADNYEDFNGVSILLYLSFCENVIWCTFLQITARDADS